MATMKNHNIVQDRQLIHHSLEEGDEEKDEDTQQVELRTI